MVIISRVLLFVFLCLITSHPAPAQKQARPAANITFINPGDSPEEIVRKAARVTPSPRQLAWQEREFIAFIHFGINTFTDREWGEGTESPSFFNPTQLDTRQWTRVIKEAGMKAIIITAKHHDGFCLWPSVFTEHSVKTSPWRNGKGDVVGELAAACKEFGLKFGVYLSPWDRHEPSYGDSPRYNEHFRNQLRELLTNYGEVSEVWFDGANGEGPNGKRQVYDWPSYYKVIRELQPGAVIFGMGPDVRWVGTESGYGRETEWSVVPDIVSNLDAIAASSQQTAVDGAFVPRDLTNEDLGSREKIMNARSLAWYPAETDVSIRPGWFYHKTDDEKVKSPEKLVDIYYSSVGRNGVLLLNIPPDKRGLIHEADVASLKGMRKILDQTFRKNFASGARVQTSHAAPQHKGSLAVDGKTATYWSAPDGGEASSLTFDLPTKQTFDRAMLQENIRTGQRVEKFRLEAWNGTSWERFAAGTTIGYKRLLRFDPVTTSRVRVLIDASRTSPTLAHFGLYKAPEVPVKKHTFAIGEGEFLLDGKPFQIISGEMHFARIPPEYWRDRFKMARAMGLNTIATYVFWNYHEPVPGTFVFEGNADVAKFIKTAQEEGLWVIVRPSPYACAEWEFGGYPWWLQKEKNLKVRSRDPRFLELSRRYFNELGKHLAPLQITHGGNIIMVQLENEYGSYDKDKEYLALNKEIIRGAGFDVDLYTCDGPTQMPNGYLHGLLPAINGLDDVKQVRELVNKHHNGKGPYFVAEWYPAWFDQWGFAHHVVPAEEYTGRLDTILANGFSINMYMGHGGTTRGFMNGANLSDREPYAPQISSYDYDAPINESGNVTPKFLAFREVIKKHLPHGVVLPEIPPAKKAMAIPDFILTERASLMENLPEPVASEKPLTFEDLDQGYGYVLYRTTLKGPAKGVLNIKHVRDYALIFINGKRVAVLDRRLKQDSVEVELPQGDVTLDMFLENNGRVNYGPYLNDNRKGITERVTFAGREVTGFKMFRFPCVDFSPVKFGQGKMSKGPVLRRGTFVLKQVADSYLDMREWGKGAAWLNGRSLGKFWNIGPQQTLYIPAPWLREGENELIVLELLEPEQEVTRGLEAPILDQVRVSKADVK